MNLELRIEWVIFRWIWHPTFNGRAWQNARVAAAASDPSDNEVVHTEIIIELSLIYYTRAANKRERAQ